MSDLSLSKQADALLIELQSVSTVTQCDATAAEELIERGYAVLVPGGALIEITQVGQCARAAARPLEPSGTTSPVPETEAEVAANQKPALPCLEMTGNGRAPYGVSMSGLGSDGQTDPAKTAKDNAKPLGNAPSSNGGTNLPSQE